MRRGWLLGGVPVSLKGIGGPGAPHVFDFQRLCNSGSFFVSESNIIFECCHTIGAEPSLKFAGLQTTDVQDQRFWRQYRDHPHDVTLQ